MFVLQKPDFYFIIFTLPSIFGLKVRNTVFKQENTYIFHNQDEKYYLFSVDFYLYCKDLDFFRFSNISWCLFFKYFKKFEVVLYASLIDKKQILHFEVHLFFSISIHKFEKNSLTTGGHWTSLGIVTLEGSELFLGTIDIVDIVIKTSSKISINENWIDSK